MAWKTTLFLAKLSKRSLTIIFLWHLSFRYKTQESSKIFELPFFSLMWERFFFFHFFSNMEMKLLLFKLACNPKWIQLLLQDGLQFPYQFHPSKPYLGPNHPFLNMGSPSNPQLFLGLFFSQFSLLHSQCQSPYL